MTAFSTKWTKQKLQSLLFGVSTYVLNNFIFGFSRKKSQSPSPCWGYQWKIQGGRIKAIGIPGGYAKIWGKKHGFQGGSKQYNEKILVGVMINSTVSPPQKNSSQHGGYIFFWKSLNSLTRTHLQRLHVKSRYLFLLYVSIDFPHYSSFFKTESTDEVTRRESELLQMHPLIYNMCYNKKKHPNLYILIFW